MSTWRYYNSKRGNPFRGRGKSRGRGRGTGRTAISLPREDNFRNEIDNDAFSRDRPMNPKDFRDETVLSLSFGQNMLGAAYYEQSTQLVRIMNDISEDHEFFYLKRLIEEVKPTIIIANRSQDLEFIKLLSSRYATHEKLDKNTTEDSTDDTIPTWDASMAYSTDDPEDGKDEDDDDFDGPPATLCKLPNNFFKMPRALERLKMLVGSEDNKMTEEEKYTIVTMRFDIEAVNMMRSFGALLLFLDETRLGVENEPLTVSPPIKSIKTITLGNLVDIDYNTIQALDILPKEVESKKSTGQNKSLFSLIDRCRSTVGKKCLRKWFRNPTTDREVLVSRQKCVHYFKQDWNAEVTSKVASILGRVKALNSVFQRFQSGTAKLIHWECFVSTVNSLVEIVHIMRQTPISSELLVENTLLREVSEVAIITGSIINFAESKIQGRVTVMPGIDEDLDRLRDTYENMPMVLTAIAKQESARFGITPYSNLTCVYIPLVGFVLSLPIDFPIESHRDMSLVYATNDELRVRNETTQRLDDEYGDILMKLIDSQTAIILILKTRVMKKKRSINKLLSLAARIDALVSMGLIAAENGWNCPTLVDESVIEALELYHPISALVVKKNFVPNQVSSGRNGVKASIITGPNACGKSVYMKSIGILAFLAHIGSFVPARHATVGVVDRIVTRMFTIDSVLDGMSTFAKDVEQVALALRKGTGNSLVIIDEFGKGTMTEVGLSLLASCMTYWMKKGDQKCPHIFLSSHFHALPKHIPNENNIAEFLTFTVHREPGGKIRYLFRLTPGMVDCSFAMAVAKEEGIPTSILGRACRIYKALKSGTPLKEVRAEVSNDNEEEMVAEMDVVLEDESGFMQAIESFVIKEKNDDAHKLIAPESREEVSTSISNRKTTEEYQKTRSNSVISAKSVASNVQLSIFDTLLPKRKKKVTVSGETTLNSTRSPDPFSVDDSDKEEEQEEEVVTRVLIPTLQKLASEEEEEQSIHSPKSKSSRTHFSENMFCTPKANNEFGGTKRPRSQSTFGSAPRKVPRQSTVPVAATQESQVLDTPIQESRARHQSSNHSIHSSMRTPRNEDMFKTPSQEPRGRHQSSNHSVQMTPTQRSTYQSSMRTPRNEDMFKTPTQESRTRHQSSSHMTPTQPSSIHPSMRTPRSNDFFGTLPKETQEFNDFNFTNTSIFKSPRSSSRREIREADTPTQHSQNFFSSPIGSQFSIFDTQQSFVGSSEDSSNHEMSFFFGPLNNDKNQKNQKKKKVAEEVFSTPKSKNSASQRSFFQKSSQMSRNTVSPSSVILGELLNDDLEKTPIPRGDAPLDFEFNMNENPIEREFRSPIFDFLNQDEEEDDETFLKRFPSSNKSLRIDTSGEETTRPIQRK